MKSSDRHVPTYESRTQALNERRNAKMASSAHAYVRGSTVQFYKWLAEGGERVVPKGPPVWICGDCHVGNLGPLADSEGKIHIQIRDLDQTVIGNPNHDLIRLALSLSSAARGSDLPGVTTAHMLEHMMEGYERALVAPSRKASEARPECVRVVMRQAMNRTWKHAGPEAQYPAWRALLAALEGRKARDQKVVRRDIKEATPAAAPHAARAKMPTDNATRVVEGARSLSPALGERMMPAHFLGRSVFLRELLPQDLKLQIDQLTRDEAVSAARYLASVVGRAHARQMDGPTRRAFRASLRSRRTNRLDAPSWLWSSVVALAAAHEAAYLEHCRTYALA